MANGKHSLSAIRAAALLIAAMLVLGGCAGYSSSTIFEVDSGAGFGEKVDSSVGLAYIFPYFGSGPGLKDFQFQCEGFSCTVYKSNFGMPSLDVFGITPVPFIPIRSGQRPQRQIVLFCTEDSGGYKAPSAVLHEPQSGLRMEAEVSAFPDWQDKSKKTITYRFVIDNVDFDAFDLELGGECGNVRLPFVKKNTGMYIPFLFPVN